MCPCVEIHLTRTHERSWVLRYYHGLFNERTNARANEAAEQLRLCQRVAHNAMHNAVAIYGDVSANEIMVQAAATMRRLVGLEGLLREAYSADRDIVAVPLRVAMLKPQPARWQLPHAISVIDLANVAGPMVAQVTLPSSWILSLSFFFMR